VKFILYRLFFLLGSMFWHEGISQTLDTITFFVAKNGNDAWSGQLPHPNNSHSDGPFASLEKAKEAILESTNFENELTKPIVVQIREGKYLLAKSLNIARVAGTKQAPVIFRSYGNEKVCIVGGKKLVGFVPLKDRQAKQRISEKYHRKVWQINVSEQQISDYGHLTARGFTLSSKPAPLELFFDSRPMQLARWPNQGWSTIADVKGSRHGNRFNYEGSEPELWNTPEEIWLHGYWARDWADSYTRVAKIDTQSKTIITEKPYGVYGYIKGGRFYALNILEELDSPGEWYLDRNTHMLYFWPPSPIKQAEVFVSMLEAPLVVLDSTSYVYLHDLTFEITRGRGITIINGHHNKISKSIIRNTGNNAITIRGGASNSVIGCDIYNTGEGGIYMQGGDRNNLLPADHRAANNHIHHYNRWVQTYCPALQVEGVGNTLENNLIHDAPHMGIMLKGNEHSVVYNEIFRVGMETGDVGAFYMGRDWSMRGNRIEYNYFHQLKSRYKRGVMAVYLDDLAGGATIHGNIFYKVQKAITIGGGRDNFVENNIFSDCGTALRIEYRRATAQNAEATMRKRLENVNYQSDTWKKKYPSLTNILEDEPTAPKGNVIRKNLVIDGKWLEIAPSAKVLQKMKNNKIKESKEIINQEDFSLNEATIRQLQKIPVLKIGLYSDELRVSWPEMGTLRKGEQKNEF